jgi:hypothetical protein
MTTPVVVDVFHRRVLAQYHRNRNALSDSSNSQTFPGDPVGRQALLHSHEAKPITEDDLPVNDASHFPSWASQQMQARTGVVDTAGNDPGRGKGAVI